MSKLGQADRLTAEQTWELVEVARRGPDDPGYSEAVNRLFDSFGQLAVHYSQRRWKSSQELRRRGTFDDLVQSCRLALFDAIRRWKPEKGAFTTCYYWAMFSALSKPHSATEMLPASLDEAIEAFRDNEPADQSTHHTILAEKDDLASILSRHLDLLPRQEQREAIVQFFGLDMNGERSGYKVAEHFGISKQAAYDLRNRALELLSEHPRLKRILQDL